MSGKDDVTSIITAMTDAERPFLKAALDSVLAQDIPAVTRVVVCVSLSNHWISDIVTPYGDRVTLLRQPLAPPGTVRNRAIATVSTTYAAFLDADDTWEPKKIRQQLESARMRGVDVIACKHILIREDGRSFFYGFADSVPMTSGWLIKTDLLKSHPFDDGMTGEDARLWDELGQHVDRLIMPEFLIRYRVRESSLSSDTWSKRRKLRFAHLSRRPLMRPTLLLLSHLVHDASTLVDRLRQHRLLPTRTKWL